MRSCRALSRKAFEAPPSQRLYNVIAWGRNAEGQCGIDGSTSLVTQPVPVEGLHELDVVSLSAGMCNSACTTSDGTCFTWGSGKSGKLGHGGNQDVACATRVESFVGRARIADVALGQNHTMFVDNSGGAWSCGENKEGQLGYGTSLKTLARQKRQEWNMSAHLATFAQAFSDTQQRQHASGRGRDDGLDHSGNNLVSSAPGWFSQPQQHQEHDHHHHLHQQQQHGRTAPNMIDHTAQQDQLDQTRELVAGSLGMQSIDSNSLFGSFGKAAGTDPLTESTLGRLDSFSRTGSALPGQHQTPIRIGRDEHELLIGRSDSDTSTGASPTEARGLAGRHVSAVAASRHFSMLLTEQREVFTCGGGYNGELGQSSSWLSSATQVEGYVRQALSDNGGATAVACGSTFSIALTTSGRAVVWGGIPGCTPPPESRKFGGVVVAELMGLPPLTMISAGHNQAVLSDGDRVWTMGSWLNKDGRRVGTPWGVPQLLAGLPEGGGIRCVSAGSRAAAAVTDDGDVYMWGRLMTEDNARALLQKTTGVKKIPAEVSEMMWPGMGGDDGPRRIPGLGRVHSIRLGFAHALALVR